MTAAVAAPRPTGARVWLLAARPATLPAAIVPVLVGTGAALHGRHELHEHIFLPILFASILIQVGTNFANDVFDFNQRLGRRVAKVPVISQTHRRIAESSKYCAYRLNAA